MTQKYDNASKALTIVRKKVPDFTTKVGIILGSGLGKLADHITDRVSIPYQELPGFSACSVAGHKGLLHTGYLNKMPIACLQGRAHYYEGATNETFYTLIKTLKLLGCETVIITNAAGSLREEVDPGSIVMINDHINFQHTNPLVGFLDKDNSPAFISMENVYDKHLRHRMYEISMDKRIPIYEGVYISVMGPCFETPAEIRAFRHMGADVVGMSTVPEVILARYFNMRVMVLSAISNFAAGMRNESLSHDKTLEGAQLASEKLFTLVSAFIQDLANDAK